MSSTVRVRWVFIHFEAFKASLSVTLPIVLYACESWNLTVRAQERLLTFENRMLRWILGTNIDPATGRVHVKD